MLRMLRKNTKIIMIIVILFFVLSCFAGYGRYVRGGNKNKGGEGMRDYPVAEAAGKKIMRSQLEQNAAQLAQQSGMREITSEDAPVIRKNALEAIVIQAEIEKEIVNRKIDATEAEINEAYTKTMDSFPTREEFLETIKRSGLSEKQVKENIRKQLNMQKLAEQIAADIDVTDEAVKEYYESVKNIVFKRPEGDMINIATFNDKSAAETAQKEIAEGGNWDEIIAKYKDKIVDATSYDEPQLMPMRMLEREEMSTLKNTPMGQVTPAIEAGENNAYIAIRRSHDQERVLTYEEAGENAKELLKSQKLHEAQQKFYESLLNRAEVKILDASIFPEENADAGETAAAEDTDSAKAETEEKEAEPEKPAEAENESAASEPAAESAGEDKQD